MPKNKFKDENDPRAVVIKLINTVSQNTCNDKMKISLLDDLFELFYFLHNHPKQMHFFNLELSTMKRLLKPDSNLSHSDILSSMHRLQNMVKEVSRVKKYQKKTQDDGLSYFEILYRPGMKAVRHHPMVEVHQGEFNDRIDLLQKLSMKLREEIIYTPQSKLSRSTKATLEEVLVHIVKIGAHDALLAIQFVKHLETLIENIIKGKYAEKFDKSKEFLSLLSKVGKHAQAQYQNEVKIEKCMWERIGQVKHLSEMKEKPKFDLEILAKSEFLRKEKIRAGPNEKVASVTPEPEIKEDECIVVELEDPSKDLPEISQLDSNLSVDNEVYRCPEEVILVGEEKCPQCVKYSEKYGDEFFK